MPPGAFSPYADGRKAFNAGRSLIDCPQYDHPEFGRMWSLEWIWGWAQAAADALGDPAKIKRGALHDHADAAKQAYIDSKNP